MKCCFKDVDCSQKDTHHDLCRYCKHVPNMNQIHNVTEMRLLCAVAGKRENQSEMYGDILSDIPEWLGEIFESKEYHIPCADHVRYNNNVVILEPYSVNTNQIRDLIKYCDRHGLNFIIDGDSAHLPGRCFRIIISKI